MKAIKAITITLLSSLTISLFSGCATTPALAGGDAVREVQYVVEITGKKQNEIYNETKLWVAENFTSAKAVIDYEDPMNGILICNGVLSDIKLESGLIAIYLSASFKMKTEAKDGKVRFTFNNFKMTNRNSDVMYETEIEQVVTRIQQFGSEIKNHILSNQASDF